MAHESDQLSLGQSRKLTSDVSDFTRSRIVTDRGRASHRRRRNAVLLSYFLLDLRNDAVLMKKRAAPKVVLKVSRPIKAKISGFLNTFFLLRRFARLGAHSGKDLETIGRFLQRESYAAMQHFGIALACHYSPSRSPNLAYGGFEICIGT